MNDIAIRVEGLGKLYHIGAKQKRYQTLVDAVSGAATDQLRRIRSVFRSPSGLHSNGSDTIWALKDVSFEIRRGEVVGIIGRNGAGKSTLLKILSRITEPTCGFAGIHGRVGSLLEVGTGFHQELTGRENIYLNGAILGMRKAEIERKFDEIVAFSEVESFIDTPVKHYSSGMRMRLAFAVAAHLESEIVIVDEVLAVGDMGFQNKCLRKMGEVSTEGRTVLLVSHNLAAIQSLSNRCLVFDAGRQQFYGDVNDGLAFYVRRFHSSPSSSNGDLSVRSDRSGEGRVRFTSICFQDTKGTKISSIPMGTPFRVCLDFRCLHPIKQPRMAIVFSTILGQRLFRLNTIDQGVQLPAVESEGAVVCEIPSMPLLPDVYAVSISISDNSGTLQDKIDSAVVLEVLAADVFGTGSVPQGPGDIIFVPSRWEALYRTQQQKHG